MSPGSFVTCTSFLINNLLINIQRNFRKVGSIFKMECEEEEIYSRSFGVCYDIKPTHTYLINFKDNTFFVFLFFKYGSVGVVRLAVNVVFFFFFTKQWQYRLCGVE